MQFGGVRGGPGQSRSWFRQRRAGRLTMPVCKSQSALAPILDAWLPPRIAEEATVGIAVIAAPDWRFVYANPAFRELVATDADLTDRTMAEVFPAAVDDANDLFGAPLNTGHTL